MDFHKSQNDGSGWEEDFSDLMVVKKATGSIRSKIEGCVLCCCQTSYFAALHYETYCLNDVPCEQSILFGSTFLEKGILTLSR